MNSQVVEKVSLVREDENISYITPTINPLSCTVVIVETGHNIWLYDTGSHSDIPAMINSYNQAKKNINIVLSHFHPDHIKNVSDIHFKNMYQGKNTLRYTGAGEIVTDDMYIDDDINLHIFPIASSHAKGCLALEVKDICYVGDALYPATGPQFRRYNAGLLLEQLRQIESCNVKYISLSHRTHFKYSKRAVVRWLKAIYKLRGANEAYIYL